MALAPLLSGVIDLKLNLLVEGVFPLPLVAVVFNVLVKEERFVVGFGDCCDDSPKGFC